MTTSEPRSERSEYSITVSRQLGSQGWDIAHRTAELMGYRIVGRELINQAAIRAGAPEAALAAIDELGLLGISPSIKARKAYRQAVQEVMEELATEGNMIIVGRAGQVILRNRPKVLHVRIIAPLQIRAERVALKQGILIDQALAQIKVSDQYRANYLRRFYKAHWDDPEMYDLVINTWRSTIEAAARLIYQVVLLKQNGAGTISHPQEFPVETL